jgi:hypothetical protein
MRTWRRATVPTLCGGCNRELHRGDPLLEIEFEFLGGQTIHCWRCDRCQGRRRRICRSSSNATTDHADAAPAPGAETATRATLADWRMRRPATAIPVRRADVARSRPPVRPLRQSATRPVVAGARAHVHAARVCLSVVVPAVCGAALASRRITRMTRRRVTRAPDLVRDETATLAPGDPGYWLLLTDDEVEGLASGVCPRAISIKAYQMLEWKREAARETARALTERTVSHG